MACVHEDARVCKQGCVMDVRSIGRKFYLLTLSLSSRPSHLSMSVVAVTDISANESRGTLKNENRNKKG